MNPGIIKDNGGSLNSFPHKLSCSLGIAYIASEITLTLQTSKVLFSKLLSDVLNFLST